MTTTAIELQEIDEILKMIESTEIPKSRLPKRHDRAMGDAFSTMMQKIDDDMDSLSAQLDELSAYCEQIEKDAEELKKEKERAEIDLKQEEVLVEMTQKVAESLKN